MSNKMTDFSFTFVSCLVSCFNKTGYRIVSPLYQPLATKTNENKTKKVGNLAETLAEKYLEG